MTESGTPSGRLARWALSLMLAAGLWGCDAQRIDRLEEGVATEADVRRQFGAPQRIHPEGDGGQTFEYSRQPEGQVAYMITLGPDGRMSALRQVLKPADFAQVVPGMPAAEVERRLGRPASRRTYDLRPDQSEWVWRWRDGTASKVFTVTLDLATGRVLTTAISDDPRETHTPG